jgi:hypothetical protein
MARLPNPVRPNFSLWLQGALILATAGDLVIPECQRRTLSDGVYHRLRRALNIRKRQRSFWFTKVLKKPAQNGTGECCLKKRWKKDLTFFWCSCQIPQNAKTEQ